MRGNTVALKGDSNHSVCFEWTKHQFCATAKRCCTQSGEHVQVFQQVFAQYKLVTPASSDSDLLLMEEDKMPREKRKICYVKRQT